MQIKDEGDFCHFFSTWLLLRLITQILVRMLVQNVLHHECRSKVKLRMQQN